MKKSHRFYHTKYDQLHRQADGKGVFCEERNETFGETILACIALVLTVLFGAVSIIFEALNLVY